MRTPSNAPAAGSAALTLATAAAAPLGAPPWLWICMLVLAVALFVRAVTFARQRQVAASPLQSGIEHQREEAAELRNRLRHLPEDEEWRQREHLQAIADQIKDDWVSRLYKLFSDMGALELRNEFMRIGGPSGAEMYQREPLIRFLDNAIELLGRMQKRLARQH